MGLLVGIVLYPVICRTSRRKMVMWTLRIAVLPVIIVLFVLLTRNFYTSDPYAGECFCVTMSHHSHLFFTACSGCRYLSCIPTNANNHCKGYVLFGISLR